MRSNTEHVIELLHTLETIEPATDRFAPASWGATATYLEHMFDIRSKCGYIRPYER